MDIPNPTPGTLDDDDESGFREPAGVAPAPQLFLVLECSRPLAGGARYALDGVPDVMLGRGSQRCMMREGQERLAIEVPDPRMSVSHATIQRTPQGFVIQDAGSRNGVIVNGQRVQRAVLSDRDVFQLGHTFFRFACVQTPDGTAPVFDSLSSAEGVPGMATLLPAFAAALARMAVVSKSSVAILLLGATGTGKEVLARAVHTLSGRSGEFVAVNCGALPQSLVESQLFGHTKGAFSGAVQSELGFVRAASGGTLFLDEIGDLPLLAQATLLRVLQEGEVVPVGATRPSKVDVRVVAATHQPLGKLVESETFRRDLFGRLAGLRVHLPPLRDRREDIGILIAAVLRGINGPRAGSFVLAPEAARNLLDHDWPLNVRELHQALSLACVLATDPVLKWSYFQEALAEVADPASPSSALYSDSERAIRLSLVTALEAHKGNVSEAARTLGKPRTQLHRWMRRFHVDPATFRQR